LRRHPERIRLPLLAFWCAPREAEVVARFARTAEAAESLA